jgi:hypothetical protein
MSAEVAADAEAIAQASVSGAYDGPPDLEAFWATTIAQLRQVPVDLRRSPRPAPSTSTVAYDLSFRSWGGQLIRGYATTWDDVVPRPFVVHAHGYRSQAVPRVDWVRAGCHVSADHCVSAQARRAAGLGDAAPRASAEPSPIMAASVPPVSHGLLMSTCLISKPTWSRNCT